ncbi:hypothetical protein [Flaviaesturariibacter amylovorans]|uniref:Uncharacterized protein n=1 Tax=Flaviaesturariibacter amylovorans TaxID=1084520 RepID=A0ABP8GKL4_9BACT
MPLKFTVPPLQTATISLDFPYAAFPHEIKWITSINNADINSGARNGHEHGGNGAGPITLINRSKRNAVEVNIVHAYNGGGVNVNTEGYVILPPFSTNSFYVLFHEGIYPTDTNYKAKATVRFSKNPVGSAIEDGDDGDGNTITQKIYDEIEL